MSATAAGCSLCAFRQASAIRYQHCPGLTLLRCTGPLMLGARRASSRGVMWLTKSGSARPPSRGRATADAWRSTGCSPWWRGSECRLKRSSADRDHRLVAGDAWPRVAAATARTSMIPRRHLPIALDLRCRILERVTNPGAFETARLPLTTALSAETPQHECVRSNVPCSRTRSRQPSF